MPIKCISSLVLVRYGVGRFDQGRLTEGQGSWRTTLLPQRGSGKFLVWLLGRVLAVCCAHSYASSLSLIRLPVLWAA